MMRRFQQRLRAACILGTITALSLASTTSLAQSHAVLSERPNGALSELRQLASGAQLSPVPSVVSQLQPLGLLGSIPAGLEPPITEPPVVCFQTHPEERRGFVSVPWDWERPEYQSIKIFYRLLGDSDKPVLVFVNGGPGSPASAYVSLDHTMNTLSELLAYFRLLLIDQRGTGCSAPLDRDSPVLSPQLVARFLGAPQHSRDMAAVMESLRPAVEPVGLLGHSYGGSVIFQYLALPEISWPQAVILASPGLPYLDPVVVSYRRRLMQIKLNRTLLGPRLDLQEKIIRLKDRIRQAAYVDSKGTPLRPEYVSVWWRLFGRESGSLGSLERWLDRLLDPNLPIEEVDRDIKGKLESSYNLLNYALLATDVFPGYSTAQRVVETDALLARDGVSVEPRRTVSSFPTWRRPGGLHAKRSALGRCAGCFWASPNAHHR